MGYRIRLSIINQKELDRQIKKHMLDNLNEEESFYLEDMNSIEIMDSIDVDKFKNYFNNDKDEYPMKKLTKKNLKEILDFYRESFEKSFLKKYKEHEDILERLSKKEIDKGTLRDAKRIIIDKDMLYYGLYNYFKENGEIKDSNFFYLQYFYIVKRYENLKEDEIILITHG